MFKKSFPIVGYLPATADLFHIGHLRAIKKAARRCDYLIVGLLDCPEYKKTIIPYKQRKEILEALLWVDKVVRQKSLKMNLKGVDVVFSGDGFEKEEIEQINKYGCKTINIGYCKEQSTTKIKQLLTK
jgi:glycerol-3-phosphate cytidylyltransferase